MEELLKQILSEIQSVKTEINDVKQSLARMENDHDTKITALFDGYTLRGDQIEKLQQHLDEKLDALLLDTNYLVSKSAQHDREIRVLKQIK